MKNLQHNIFKIASLAILFFTLYACQDLTDIQQDVNQLNQQIEIDMLSNNFEGELPPSMVPLKDYIFKQKSNAFMSESGNSLESEIEATLKPTESHTQTLTGKINGAPSSGDVMFILDLTGSMGGVLNTAKANSINIMNSLRSLIPDTNFGAISHMDYNGVFGGCGYGPTNYGSGIDYPYRLDANLSSDLSSTANGINSMVLGFGNDGPENFTRPLWELYNDESLNWRAGSKKIAIFWLDNLPHDCNVYSLLGINGFTTGPDPGRDEIVGTADDLEFAKTINELKENGITLITLFSGGTSGNPFALWKAASQLTGGDAFPFNSSSPDVADFISAIISENLSKINNLSITSCDPTFASWLTDVDPSSYEDIILDEPIERLFDVTITVPEGTAPGVYTFDLCLIGDGAEYAKTSVTITVPDQNVTVAFDVHPGSCPNPIQLRRNGVIPTAILGAEGFDVNDIDVSSITLEGVSPIGFAYDDVAISYESSNGVSLDANACHTLGEDGYTDLTLRFNSADIIKALGSVSSGDVIKVKIIGKLLDGTDFEGEDVVIIR
ncbi:hypothetical protein [Belliella pelovolcani]|uniref:hypothetical protein n=1 Tax=Belliella pelovolcani TaxID=529505 RepID=UPI00391BDAE8